MMAAIIPVVSLPNVKSWATCDVLVTCCSFKVNVVSVSNQHRTRATSHRSVKYTDICALEFYIRIWQFPRRLKHRTMCSNTSTSGIHPKEWKAGTQTGTCPSLFTAAALTRAKRWKCTKCPSMEEWINKVCYIRIMEYYWTVKRLKFWHILQHGWASKMLCPVK